MKTRKACEIAVERNPLAAGFDGQGSEPGVGYQVSPGIGFGAKARESIPVPLARLNNNAVGLFKEELTEAQRLFKAARLCEHFWVGCDTDDAAEDLRRNAKARIAVDAAIEPTVAGFVI